MTDRDLVAQALPRYEVRGEIGRGGWGVVYEGWHRDLRRPVAIKQLPSALGTDAGVRDRFIAEAQLVAGLEHPHIVPVYDFAERDGLYVIVMELATGGTVWERFSKVGLQTDHAVATVLATAVGLHYAHSKGLLHRDVKPDNVLYSTAGTAKIADFGIAKSMGENRDGRTATNSLIGSPAYMAPEQVTGAPLSPATDVYALGVVLYQLLSGELPFEPASDTVAQLFQHVHEDPRPLSVLAPQVPTPLADAAHRALQKESAARPQTAEDFAVELATAATQAYGIGWLERTGMDVMGSTPVIAATERAPSAGATGGETMVVHPADVERFRLGQLQSAPSTAPAQAASRQTGSPPQAASRQTGSPPQPESDERGARRWLVPLTAVGVLAAIVVALVVLLGGGDDGDPVGVIPAAVTASDQALFRTTCQSNGVGAERCECALTRAVDLDAEVFRTNLAVMVDRAGSLGPEFESVFVSCVADGF